MTPALKASRGLKRRCQNEACGLPFYDLNREAIVCPNCAVAYVVAAPQPRPAPRGRYLRTFAAPVASIHDPEAATAVEAVEEASDSPLIEQTDGDQVLEIEEEEEGGALPVVLDEEPSGEE